MVLESEAAVKLLRPGSFGRDETRAVARAAAEARPGDTVLLAPAAASFDQYPDFEARGEDFMAEVARLGA